jgi:HemY protein
MHVLRSALFLIVVALALALAAQVFLQDPGLVLVRYRGSDYTTTVPYAVAIGLAGLAALWLLVRLVTAPVHALRRRRDRTERRRLAEGLSDLHEGRWARGERTLLATDDPDAVAIARVHAARAAAARGEASLAQQHLESIRGTHAGLRAVTLAELALAQGRPTSALAALDDASAQPLPPRGLALRAQALAEIGHYDEAYGMLAALRKADAVPAADLPRLESRWARGMLAEAPDGNALAARWESLPKALRHDPAVVGAYAERAAAFHWDDAAARAIEETLDSQWDEALAAQYGRLSIGRLDERAARIDRWMSSHPHSPGLLLSRARLHYAHGDWPQAEASLQQALHGGAGPEAWELLGHGYAAAGDERRARVAYANALRVTRGEGLIELPPEAYPPMARDTREVRDAHGMPRLQ